VCVFLLALGASYLTHVQWSKRWYCGLTPSVPQKPGNRPTICPPPLLPWEVHG